MPQRSSQRSGDFPRVRDQGESGNRANSGNMNMPMPNGGGFGMGNSSRSGITRLFSNNNLSDQISWFLPLAILGFLAAAIRERLNSPFDNKRKLSIILWFMWLLPECIYFSFTKGSFHTYYLTTMAPPIAALVGIGLSAMWELYKEGGWKSWLLPTAFIVNGILQIHLLSYNYSRSNSYKIIILITAILCFAASIILAVFNIIKNKNAESYYTKSNAALKKILVSISFIGLLITPTVWSFTPMFYQMNGSSPSAGLELSYSRQRNDSTINSNSKLIKFLESNKTKEKYLVAVPSAMNYASDLILETGEPVMTLGGFSGSDKIITANQFKQLVDEGAIRYALVNGGNGGRGNLNSDVTNWIKENGQVVPESQWKDSSGLNNQIDGKDNNNNRTTNSVSQGFSGFGDRNSVQLYDLKPNANN